MALPMRVTLAPGRVDSEPGGSFTIDVTVRNTSDIVEHYVVEALGLPAGATVRAEPEVTKLRPGEEASVALRVALPRQPPAPAGSYVEAVDEGYRLHRGAFPPDRELRLLQAGASGGRRNTASRIYRLSAFCPR